MCRNDGLAKQRGEHRLQGCPNLGTSALDYGHPETGKVGWLGGLSDGKCVYREARECGNIAGQRINTPAETCQDSDGRLRWHRIRLYASPR